MSARGWKRGLCVGMAVAASSAAGADDMLVIRASSGLGSGQLALQSSSLVYDPAQATWRLSFAGPRNIVSESGAVIASISAGDLWVRSSSQIDLNLTVVSGAAQASIDIESIDLSFARIPANLAQARARARCHVYDLNGNGAQLLSNGTPGEGVFRGLVNPYRDGAATFSQLVGFVSCGPNGNAYGQQLDPPSGTRAVGAAVDSFAVDMGFLLSAGDRVVISTTFDVDPNPGSCRGDLDGDQRIAISDLVILIGNFGADGASSEVGDFDADGEVGMSDLTEILHSFGDGCP